MDKSGLGQGQTKRLARLLNPDSLMIIDSSPFNGNHQYPEWYDNAAKHVDTVYGFPDDNHVEHFLQYVDVVISCETFYNNNFTHIAKQMGVKTVLIANPEFFDWFTPQYEHISLPTKVINPSHWNPNGMNEKFNTTYLPTPIFKDEFKKAREVNLKRTGRKFLFIYGKTTHKDRQGLGTLYEALQLAKGDFTVTIKSQSDITKHPDPRIIYDHSNPDIQNDMYEGYDCLIHPRRYAGQSLVMCEGLQSGLPVIMLDREPDNKVLPKDWLLPCKITDKFMARTEVDIYTGDAKELANKLDNMDVGLVAKKKASALGKQYDAETLRPEYERLLSSL